MKILYVGPLFPGSTALHRMRALEQLGCQVNAIKTELPLGFRIPKGNPKWWIKRIMQSTDIWADWKRIHQQLDAASRNEQWDILWVDKGRQLRPKALTAFARRQKNCRLVNYSPDDMFNPANQTARYCAAFGIYDLFVTTKSYNVDEFKAAGASDVFFVGNAYEPTIHRPVKLNEEEQKRWSCDVCFVGDCEPERERSIARLAEAGVKLGLFGPWAHLAAQYNNVVCHKGFFADDAYAKVLQSGKIGLGFLRKVNRDLQTTRSIELPACGVFMLAERTEEHQSLFEEGREAEFFASDEELIEKVLFYLANNSLREKIATAGRQRCLESGYSNMERLRSVLNYISLI